MKKKEDSDMKKTRTRTLAAILILGALGTAAHASDDSASVYVTIADGNGDLAMTYEAVEVTDIDGDGTLTINDALYCAHEENFDGGAAAGYGTAMTDYGLSMTKLWGAENGTGYGYVNNDVSAWGLTDPVTDGDHVSAYVYTDLVTWSDTFCYFDKKTASGEMIELTLTANGWDENYAPITVPVESAVITVNGEKTDIVTDANGNAVVSIPGSGTFVISAESETQTLVPPVCIVNNAPQTSDGTAMILLSAMAGFAGTVFAYIDSRKKNYEN